MQIDDNSIDVVIVTYGNRWNYVAEVIKRVFSFPEVNSVILVNNGSIYNVNLKVQENFSDVNVIVENPGENLGSAGGYKLGIESALNQKGKMIWLLDDDNLPSEDSVSIMKDVAKKIKDSKMAITGYRKNWINRSTKELSDIQNTFFEFSLLNKLRKNKKNPRNDYNTSKRLYVPYGGLLFEKKAISEIGFPNEQFYLYVDDTDFTFRLTQKGYTIYCTFDAEIVDLEDSWAQEVSEPMFKAIFKVDNPYRGLMNIRNRAYFEKNNLEKNKLIYFFNMGVYLMFVFINYMPKNKKGMRLFKKMLSAISKGRRGKLGSTV